MGEDSQDSNSIKACPAKRDDFSFATVVIVIQHAWQTLSDIGVHGSST